MGTERSTSSPTTRAPSVTLPPRRLRLSSSSSTKRTCGALGGPLHHRLKIHVGGGLALPMGHGLEPAGGALKLVQRPLGHLQQTTLIDGEETDKAS